MIKKSYRNILDSLNSDRKESLHVNSKVLIVDSLNTFIRCFAIINQMNPSGHHIGGLTGFLRSIGYAIKTLKPTRVILVFDGLGGSASKRLLFPEYKSQRKITKISNWDQFESKGDESDSITSQIIQLIQYLKCLPIDLISIDKVEADDVIGYLAKKLQDEVYIMSTDKDFLQIVNDRISVFNPTKKKIYTPIEVKKECLVSPVNYLNSKVLCGDQSDNVPGISGLGAKTLIKLFPELKEDTLVTLNEIIEKSKTLLNKNKSYSKIVLYENQLRINEKLMDLTNPNLSDNNISEIENLLADPKKTMDISEFIRLYNSDLLGKSIMNVQVWLREVFEYLKNFK